MTRYIYEEGAGYLIKAIAEDGGLLDVVEPAEIIAALRAVDTGGPAAAEEWSEWLTHDGGPCPLPPGVYVQWASPEGVSETTPGPGNWEYPGRYRYRHTIPGGWIERGDFVPPASLWAEGSQVRCEWACVMPSRPVHGTIYPDDWDGITHIRLLPAEPAKARLPEGFTLRGDGTLVEKGGVPILWPTIADRYGTATILAAVKAWCAEMEERG